jgi:hypothetical protein
MPSRPELWALTIFLCVNDLPHDQCNEETALQISRPAEHWLTPAGCATAAMQVLAVLDVPRRRGDEPTHAVVRCVKTN